MADYINKNEVLNLIMHNDKVCHYADERYENVVYATAQTICKVVADMPAADVQPVNPLVKVEERVPNASGNYLCYLANGEFDVLYFDREIEDDMYNNDYPFGIWNTYPSEDGGECREWIEVLEVTHWQPLPEPPKDGDTE